MSQFRYEAVDPSGVFRVGIISAGTIKQAIDELSAHGFHVRRVEPARNEEEALEITDFSQPLTEDSARSVAQFLSDAIDAELPLEPALRAAAEEAPRSERRVLLQVADRIAQGKSVEQAFMEAGEALPSHLLALILAGLEGGDLPRLLSSYLTLSRQRAEVRRPLLISFAYPVALFVGSAAIIILSLIFIVPQFEKIFDDFGSNLPFMTVALIAISQFVRSFWWPMLATLAFIGLAIALYWFLIRQRGLKLTSLPLLDLFIRAADWGQFCALLGLLIEGRQPLPRALRLAAASATTIRVRSSMLAVADDVEQGLTPWEATSSRPIPGPIRQVFRWAYRPATFTEALAGLSELYVKRARFSAALLGIVLEPFALIFVASTIGFIVIALFLPLIKLLNDLS